MYSLLSETRRGVHFTAGLVSAEPFPSLHTRQQLSNAVVPLTSDRALNPVYAFFLAFNLACQELSVSALTVRLNLYPLQAVDLDYLAEVEDLSDLSPIHRAWRKTQKAMRWRARPAALAGGIEVCP